MENIELTAEEILRATWEELHPELAKFIQDFEIWDIERNDVAHE